MSKRELESYNRNHDYKHSSEVEKGKIKKESKKHAKYRKKAKDLTENSLRNIRSLSDFDESYYEEIEEVNYKAKKEKGNAQTHKERLNKLKKYDEFE